MADRRATNKYYPPEWTPAKGSLNTFVGQHPLRQRARKLDQGILVIRFELPFNIWCNGCNNHIGRGVRFNAEKKTVGKYLSTPILSFRMKCHLCDNWFEIRTDPQARDYVVTEGARKKHEDFSTDDAETIPLADDKEAELLASNPLYRAEHDAEDKDKARRAMPSINELIERRKEFADDYEVSRLLRRRFREEKKLRTRAEADAKAIASRAGIAAIPLVDELSEDREFAKHVQFRASAAAKSSAEFAAKTRKRVLASPVFKPAGISPAGEQLLRRAAAVQQRRGGDGAPLSTMAGRLIRAHSPSSAPAPPPTGLVDYSSDSDS